MITMAPLLKAYQNGTALSVALDKFIAENPAHLFAQVLKKVYFAYDHLEFFDDAIAATQSIDYKDYAIEEQLIFLQFLCQLYISAGRISSARAILATINRLITKNLAIEWQVIPFELEGSLYRVEGYHRKHMQSLEKCLEMLGLQSGKYAVVLGIYLSQLCLIHELDKFETNLIVFKKLVVNMTSPRRLDYILALRNAESFNLETMLFHIKNVREDKILSYTEHDLQICENFYQIFINNNFDILKNEESGNWALISCVHILKNEPKKALFWAHKLAEQQIEYILQSAFNSYIFIRASLANRNTSAAEYTLEKKKEFDNTCLYDDFFWFRIHHLKGNNQIAQHYFNLFSKNVEKYHLEKRFDVELRLSPEITLTDLRRYTKNLNAPEEITKPATNTLENNSTDDPSIGFIIGNSQAIKLVKDLVKKYSTVDTTVLIIGETGTGKELVAKALWQAGPYKDKPYIPINCGAISDHLLQSELFGHQKGAFTGAFQDHKGVFETAEEGIVFLDEIGEISSAMQISLLRILEAREYRPVGSNVIRKLKCKIIAATNRNLTEHVASGKFRQDLQYRLERLTIEVPPLRKRTEDISVLINHFLNELNPNLKKLFFDKNSLQHLSALQWPGNIRELRNEMERIRLFYSDKTTLTISELSEKYLARHSTLAQPKITKLSKINSTPKSLLNLKSKFRQLEELKVLFQTHKSLSRIEVAGFLKVSSNTAANYLNSLECDGYIAKITSTNSAKTQYFEIVSSKKSDL